jgi:hypothetical protein
VGTPSRLRPSPRLPPLFDPAVDEVLPPLPEDPRGTARPVVVPPFEPPPRRPCSARSDRGALAVSGAGELLPIQPAPLFDEDDPELAPADGLDDPDPDEAEPPPPLSRGTAEPTVSPFDGRDPDWESGADRCPAHAGARLSVKAEAINPTVNFWRIMTSS